MITDGFAEKWKKAITWVADAVAANPEEGLKLVLEHKGAGPYYDTLVAAFEDTKDLPTSERVRAVATELKAHPSSEDLRAFGRLLEWADSNYYEKPKRTRGRRRG